MYKWEVDEHKQWSKKVRSHRFCWHMLHKNRNYEINENRSCSPWGRAVPILKMRRFSCLLRLSLPPEMGVI